MKAVLKSVVALMVAAGAAGCETKAGTGALVGGAAGAGLGAIIGNQSHGHAAGGAVIGGLVGAGTGALIGNEMDKSDARDQQRQQSYNTRDPQPTRSYSNDTRGVTRQDVISWTGRGTSDDIIIDRIERSHTKFYLSAADETQLRDNGVSEEVIRTMRDTGRRD